MLNFLRALWFYLSVKFTKIRLSWLPHAAQHKKLKAHHIHMVEGQQYKLGSATVTLMKFGVEGKEQCRQLILQAYLLRRAHREVMRKRAEEIMMMTPEQLSEFQILSWLKNRNEYHHKVYDDINKLPTVGPPSGRPADVNQS